MQMNFSDAIVIEINGLANSILRNFESAIQIPSECCFEVEPEREAERVRLQMR